MKIPQFVKKLTGGVTLACFIASSCPQPLLAALPEADTSFQPLVVSKLEVPQETGTIEEFFQGNKPFQVVLIRDAHAIPEAQRNIQALIELFQKNYGIRRVGVEGATGEMDAQILRSFPQKEKLREVLNVYMERGEWTGVNGSALFSGENTVYEGLEDWDLYQNGLDIYRRALIQEPDLLTKLAQRKENINQQKQKIYSSALLSIDTALEQFAADHKDVSQTLQILATIKRPESPALLALLQEVEEQGAEAGDIENELRKTAIEIKRKNGLDAKSDVIFNEKLQAYQTGQMTDSEFAGFLRTFEALPARLDKLASRYDRLKELEGSQVMKDFEAFGESVKASLFKGPEQKELDRQSREIRLLEKFAKLEISRDEWVELRNRKLQDEHWQQHFIFYQNAEAREKVIVENLLKMAGQENVVVVAGGFHTEGLAEALKQQSISYAVIRPDIRVLPEQSFYRSQIRGIFSWSRYFQAENGQVNLYKAFIQALRDELLGKFEGGRWKVEGTDSEFSPSSFYLLKTWRDQLIRDLAAEGRQGEISDYWSLLESGQQNSAPVMSVVIREKWIKNIERFIDKFKILQSEGKLTEESIIKILQPSAIPAESGAVLFPRSAIRASRLTAQSENQAFHHASMIIQPRSEVRGSDEVQSLAKRINEIELKLKTDVENSPEKLSELVPEINTAMTKAHELLIDYFLQARNFNGVSTFDEKTVKSLNHLAVSIFNLFHQLTRKRSLIYIDPSWAVLRAHQATEAISFLTSYARADGVNALQFWGTVDWVAKIYAKRLKNFLKAYEAESPTLKQRDRLEHPGVAFNLAKKGLIIYFDYLEYLRELKPTPYPAELMPLSYSLSKMARLSVKLLFEMESSPEIESKFHNAATAELSEFAARSIPLLTEISGQLQDPTPGTEDSNLQQFQYFKDTLRYLIAEFKTRSEVRVKQETDESKLGELIGHLKIKGGEELELRKGESYHMSLKTIPGFNLYRKVQSESGRPAWETVLYYAYEEKIGTIYQFLSVDPAGSPAPRALLSWLASKLKKENKKIYFDNVINPKMAALMEKIASQIEVEIAFAPSQGWSPKPDWAKAEAILGNESKREFYVSGFLGRHIGKFQLQRDGDGYQLTSVADGWIRLSDNAYSLSHQYEVKGYELREGKMETKISKSSFTVKLENGAISIDAPAMDDTYPDPQISFYIPVNKEHPSFPYLKDYKLVDPRTGSRSYVVRTVGYLEPNPPSFELEISEGGIRFKGAQGNGVGKILNFRHLDRLIKILFEDQKIVIDDPNPDSYLIFYSLMDRSTFTMRGEPNPIDVPEFTPVARQASLEAETRADEESKRSEVRGLGSEWIEKLEPVVGTLSSGTARSRAKFLAFEQLVSIGSQQMPAFDILMERGQTQAFNDSEIDNVMVVMRLLATGYAASVFEPGIMYNIKTAKKVDEGFYKTGAFFQNLQSYLKMRTDAWVRPQVLTEFVAMSEWMTNVIKEYRAMAIRTRKLSEQPQSIREDPDPKGRDYRQTTQYRLSILGLAKPLAQIADVIANTYFEILYLLPETDTNDKAGAALRNSYFGALSDLEGAFITSVDLLNLFQESSTSSDEVKSIAKSSLNGLEQALKDFHETRAAGFLNDMITDKNDDLHYSDQIFSTLESARELIGPRSEVRQSDKSSDRLALNSAEVSVLALGLSPKELEFSVDRSELRKASQDLARSGITPNDLRESLLVAAGKVMARAGSSQQQEFLDDQIARTVAIQQIEANLLKTLLPENFPEGPFAFGGVLPEKNRQEFSDLFVKAVRPGAVVLIEGKLPNGFSQKVRERGGQIRPESMDKAIELPGNQPDAAIVLEGGLSEIFHEMFRPFLLDPKNLDPEVRHLGVTLLSVAAAHYGMLVSKDPSLKLKPEVLKNELLKRLQQFEKFPDLFEILSSGKTWGLGLIGRKLEEFVNRRAAQVSA